MDETNDDVEEIAFAMAELLAVEAFRQQIIPANKVWDRVLAAITASAAATESYGEFVDRALCRMQIGVVSTKAARELARICNAVGDGWPQLRRRLETQSRYIVGMALARRDERKEQAKLCEADE